MSMDVAREPDRSVIIDYTNWQGKRRWRRITPLGLRFGVSGWHTEPQWLLHARDDEADDRAIKEFALKDIHAWGGDHASPPPDRDAIVEMCAKAIEKRADECREYGRGLSDEQLQQREYVAAAELKSMAMRIRALSSATEKAPI